MKKIISVIFFCIGCIVLYFVAQHLITTRVVPPLNEFIASSTPMIASSTSSSFFPSMKVVTIHASSSEIYAVVADTDASRAQGLSGIVTLPDKNGMLFTFSNPGMYGFWMKDMNIPLDMVWIDDAKKVISISENVEPKTFPKSFYPASPASYVLEINAHSAQKFGIATGTILSF